MRLPRFRLRTMMIFVAVVAVGLGGWMMLRRSAEYWRLAALYAQMEAWHQNDPRLSAHEAAMKRRYEYAARHPWLPVPDSPPEPE